MRGLTLKDVRKAFDGTEVCAGVSLHIDTGEFFTFLGPSGCGKTTILRMIAGFVHPDHGSITLDGRDITRTTPEQRQVGMVFQNYALFPYLNVAENIAYGLKIQGQRGAPLRDRVHELMTLIGLEDFGTRRISELSGGEQQRVALARSLAIRPQVLLLDEPLSNLDARLRDRMRGEIKTLQRSLGITTIFVTHDQTEALTLSDRIAVFDQGRVTQIGTPQDIYARPQNTFVAGFVGDTNLLPVQVQGDMAVVSDNLHLQLDRPETGTSISVRPQDILLDAADGLETRNTFSGHIRDVQINGVWIDYTVELHGIELRVAALNSVVRGPHLLPGQSVRLTIPPAGIVVLEN